MSKKTSFADWVSVHGSTGASLDPDAPVEDLKFLDELVGDARVVALGESAHYVREFHLLRHRFLRYLVLELGFTVYAIDAPFTESHAIDAWVKGGAGTVAEVAGSMPLDVGRCPEVHGYLSWMRSHNATAARPVTFAGIDMPRSGGSPLASLAAVEAYLADNDPDALSLLGSARELVNLYADTTTMTARPRYARLDDATQDALTAVFSRLLARMDSMTRYQRSNGRLDEHALAVRHLRSAWFLDHYYRDCAGRGIHVGSACRDALMAESVLELLDRADAPRVVLASHNAHLRKTLVDRDDDRAFGLFPLGHHLASELGDDYVAVAATTTGGRTSRLHRDADLPLGFVIRDHPVPPAVEGSIESAFASAAPFSCVDLRAAGEVVDDASSFLLTRKDDGFMNLPVFDAYDAVVSVPETTCNDNVSAQR